MESDASSLGKYLRSLRKQRSGPSVTGADVARALGVERGHIWKIENDKARLFADQLDRYLDAIGATMAERAVALALAGERAA